MQSCVVFGFPEACNFLFNIVQRDLRRNSIADHLLEPCSFFLLRHAVLLYWLQVPVYKGIERVILQKDECTNKASCTMKSS